MMIIGRKILFSARLWLFCTMALTAQAEETKNWLALDPEKSAGTLAACTLVTPHKIMDDSQGQTEVWLEINPKALTIKTRSDIDTAFNDVGIRVDEKEVILFDEVSNKTNVMFSNAVGPITEEFIRGLNVQVQLRFWPTWPSAGPRTADFSLIGFTKALDDLTGCGTKPQAADENGGQPEKMGGKQSREGNDETGDKI